MAWFALFTAGVFEVVWAFAMKLSVGFTRVWPTAITFVTLALSFGLLCWSMRSLPLGTAYMVWTGIGAVGTFALGVLFLGEEISAVRVIAALMIVGGLVLMQFSSSS